MGLAIARWLGRGLQARLVLTARRPLPPKETWDAWLAEHPADDPHAQAIAAVREIEACGGEVLPLAVDVADEAAMADALHQARTRFGTLHGVFHAAGVAGRGSLARRSTPEESRAVFAPKVGGLHVLRRLLGGEPLDLMVLVGSISAVVPAPGVCDYAAANAVLDAFVDSDERPAGWRQVVAIDWGAWREVGMAARLSVPEELRVHWAAHVAGGIAPAAGIEALSRVLASRRRRVIVETYDVVGLHEALRHPPAPAGNADDAGTAPAVPQADTAGAAGASAAKPAAAASVRPALSTPYVAPATEIERRPLADVHARAGARRRELRGQDAFARGLRRLHDPPAGRAPVGGDASAGRRDGGRGIARSAGDLSGPEPARAGRVACAHGQRAGEESPA
jgi:NAD(P)-dependent dehydrogenase (short-subunit alcohol dehydrogenase family)